MSSTTTGGLTETEITALKQKNKVNSIMLVTVKTEEGQTHYFWFKPIDMTTMSAATPQMASDPVAAAKIIIQNTLIEGDNDLLQDVAIFTAVSEKILAQLTTAQAELKKL